MPSQIKLTNNVVVTGAGISVESGIQLYTQKKGLWVVLRRRNIYTLYYC